MKSIGMTIGVGSKFSHMAKLACGRFKDVFNLDATVLGKSDMDFVRATKPHHLKFELFKFTSAERIVWFDADMVFLQPFDLGSGFRAVHDLATEPWIIDDAARAGISPTHYFNSGLMVIPKQCQPLLLKARDLQSSIRTPFHDQTHLNAAAAQLDIQVQWLPKECNQHVDPLYTESLNDIVGAHVHWLKDRTSEFVEWYFSDPVAAHAARTLA